MRRDYRPVQITLIPEIKIFPYFAKIKERIEKIVERVFLATRLLLMEK